MIIKYDFLSKVSGEISEVEVGDELGKVMEQMDVSTPSNTTILSSIRLNGETAYTTYSGGTTSDKFILFTFFAYPAEVRKTIYTTNIIEGLNRQFRKITKISRHLQAMTAFAEFCI